MGRRINLGSNRVMPLKERCKRVTLSNIYEVTEIVYSGVEPDDLEYD